MVPGALDVLECVDVEQPQAVGAQRCERVRIHRESTRHQQVAVTAMTDAAIGRILVASLHQSIGDVLPQRLEYYEHWLTPTGLSDGRMGLAPLGAVISFLRQEGGPTYDEIMARAGRYSADWHHAEHRGAARAARLLPRRLRLRFGLRRVRRLVASAFGGARTRTMIRKGAATLDIRESVFCGTREPWPWPTCGYFATAAERQLELLGVDVSVSIVACRAVAGDLCRLRVEPGRREAEEPA